MQSQAAQRLETDEVACGAWLVPDGYTSVQFIHLMEKLHGLIVCVGLFVFPGYDFDCFPLLTGRESIPSWMRL